jgi:hypothetical protein
VIVHFHPLPWLIPPPAAAPPKTPSHSSVVTPNGAGNHISQVGISGHEPSLKHSESDVLGSNEGGTVSKQIPKESVAPVHDAGGDQPPVPHSTNTSPKPGEDSVSGHSRDPSNGHSEEPVSKLSEMPGAGPSSSPVAARTQGAGRLQEKQQATPKAKGKPCGHPKKMQPASKEGTGHGQMPGTPTPSSPLTPVPN